MNRFRAWAACGLLLGCGSVVLPAGASQATAAQITGTVVLAEAGIGIRRARVLLIGGDRPTQTTTISDEAGRFTFSGIAPGDYILSAAKLGYLNANFGERVPGSGGQGREFRLTSGERREGYSIQMSRGAAITGVIRDDFGDPAFEAVVRALKYVVRSGRRDLIQAGTAKTDERGVYRIPLLTPGEYVVSATWPGNEESVVLQTQLAEAEAKLVDIQRAAAGSPSADVQRDVAVVQTLYAQVAEQYQNALLSGRLIGYAPTYYPTTAHPATATSVALDAGQNRDGVDIQLQTVRTRDVSGRVVNSDGAPISALVQLIDPAQPAIVRPRPRQTTTEGSFSLRNVLPGRYTLFAATIMGSGSLMRRPVLWGAVDVVANDGDASGIVVPLREAMSISGLVRFEPDPNWPNPRAAGLTIRAVAVESPFNADSAAAMVVDEGGQFTIRDVLPGRYRIEADGIAGPFRVKSSMFNGRDTLDFPVEVKPGEELAGGVVTLSGKSTTLNVVVQAENGPLPPGHTLILFASNERDWSSQSRRIQVRFPKTDGRVSFQAPPGDYRLAAVPDVEPGQWFDPAFLRQLIGVAMSITLAEGESKTQSVRVR